MQLPEDFVTRTQQTRRHLLKTAGILAGVAGVTAAAVLAEVRVAKAGNTDCGNGNNHIDNGNGAAAGGCNCFLEGTEILTSDGPKRIEQLAVGDLLVTEFGGLRPIQWIGYYSYKRADASKPWARGALPVRLAPSAIAPGIPSADLYVTSEHGLYIDGVIVPVHSLINGTTIKLHEAEDCCELKYYHVKLETHDVIYAEGAPCETLQQVSEAFANFADYLRRYGDDAERADIPCAPVLCFNGGRSEVKSRLRSALAPWVDCRHKLDIIRDRIEERALQAAMT
jgi:hypothetical protein